MQIFKILIAVGLILFMVQKGYLDFSLLGSLLRPEIGIPLLLVSLINILILSYRWHLLLRHSDLPASITRSFQFYLIGIFFNYALPGAIGGDVVKAYYIAQDHPQRKMDAITTVLVDRILGLYAMILLAFAAFASDIGAVLHKKEIGFIALMVLGLFLCMTLFLSFALSRRLRHWGRLDELLEKLPLGTHVKKAYLAIHAYRNSPRLILKSILFSLFAQVLAVGFMILVGYGIGETHFSWSAYFFVVPVGFIATAIPLAPAGIGVGQVAFLFLFKSYSGVESQLGQIAITAFQISQFIWGIFGAYFYLKMKRPKDLTEESLA